MLKPRGYIPSLDGLRAIAVLMVFSHHYWPKLTLHCGWTGVNLFFVLSGFLITGILWDNREQPNRLRNFYIRRILRIFPLYYAVWAAMLLLSVFWFHFNWNRWVILWPLHLGNYVRFLVGGYGSDYSLSTGIFHSLLPAINYGHFWSLCIEEQFYLFWPFLVYAARSRQQMVKICTAIIILSPIIRIILLFTLSQKLLGLEFMERITLLRLDGLALGGLIALLLRGEKDHEMLSRRTARNVLLLGLPGLLLTYLVFTHRAQSTADPIMSTIGFNAVDLFAAGLILETIHTGSWFARLLNFRPLRMLGKISYGFYIFHDLPRTFFLRYGASGYSFRQIAIAAFLWTVAICTISYWLLEMPFLRLKDKWAPQRHRTPSVS